MSEPHHSQKPSTRLQVLEHWQRYCLYCAITVGVLVSLVSIASLGSYFFRDNWLPVVINQSLHLALPDWHVVDLHTEIDHISTHQLRLRRFSIELKPKPSLHHDNTTAASAERIILNARNIALDWSKPSLFPESSTPLLPQPLNYALNNLTIASLEVNSQLSPTNWQQLGLTTISQQQEAAPQKTSTGDHPLPAVATPTMPPPSLTHWLQQQRKQIPLANVHVQQVTWQHNWLAANQSPSTESKNRSQNQVGSADKHTDSSQAASLWQQPWRISGALDAQPEQVSVQLHADYLQQPFSVLLSSDKDAPLWLSASWRGHTTAQISLAPNSSSGSPSNNNDESVYALWWLQHDATGTGISDLWHRHPFLKTLVGKLLPTQPEEASPYELDTLFKQMPQSGHSHWLATLPNPLQHLTRDSSTSANNNASHSPVDIQAPKDDPSSNPTNNAASNAAGDSTNRYTANTDTDTDTDTNNYASTVVKTQQRTDHTLIDLLGFHHIPQPWSLNGTHGQATVSAPNPSTADDSKPEAPAQWQATLSGQLRYQAALTSNRASFTLLPSTKLKGSVTPATQASPWQFAFDLDAANSLTYHLPGTSSFSDILARQAKPTGQHAHVDWLQARTQLSLNKFNWQFQQGDSIALAGQLKATAQLQALPKLTQIQLSTSGEMALKAGRWQQQQLPVTEHSFALDIKQPMDKLEALFKTAEPLNPDTLTQVIANTTATATLHSRSQNDVLSIKQQGQWLPNLHHQWQADVSINNAENLAAMRGVKAWWPALLQLQSGQAKLTISSKGQGSNWPQWQKQVAITADNISGNYNGTPFSGVTTAGKLQGTQQLTTTTPWSINLSHTNLGVEIDNCQSDLNSTIDLPNASMDTTIQPRFTIETLRCELLGGNIAIKDPVVMDSLDFAKTTYRANLMIEGWDLLKVAETLQHDELAITGEVDGHLPLTWSPAGPSINNGQLTARQPGGTIRYQLPSGKQALGSNPQLMLALSLLDNFHYQTLSSRVDLSPDLLLSLGLSIKGKNPAVENGRSTQFNLNIDNELAPVLEYLYLNSKIVDGIEDRFTQ